MDNNLLVKIGSKTKAGVKKVALPVAEELGEQIKKAPLDITKQLTGDEASDLPTQPSPIVEAMQQSTDQGELTREEKITKARKHIQKVEELEEEIKKAKKKKKAMENQMAGIRDPEKEEENIVQPGEPIIPPSPPSRGDLFGVKRKQQQIETKLGKD
ncbi:hypothetical protein A2Z22_04145 [Candidatus Woesebacteria bacterium RBG_16_34_12]|uniref:Uncharacterized protein n=1 Tax=Candidatus Woesebacteria bacterium RBG_16_34_12 TaxID=1802480 RepID=A0A1F7X7J6_9BACT|nr:MAG: hypothetical protein A2Z22_04145 [Candidatus Woesebacteria bacterium RBG_16_34_12]